MLVSAPAGFGKSTLLAEWLVTGGVRGAWLALDHGDSDVVRFARGLVAAAEGLLDDPAKERRDATELIDPDLALARTLDALGAALDAGPSAAAAIVLDDYHLVDEPAVHALVGTLLERLPPGAVLAIATRVDPPLPLARLRARGELVELRAADLRFSEDEADGLLRAAGVALDQAELEALLRRTEGWAAALRLAAVSLRDRPDPAELVRRFGASHRFVLDYVADEILAGLPDATQGFLLRTSILDRLTGPLCDALTGGDDGAERLEAVERLNLLIVPLDEERRWYRYHALFAEILRARLRALHPDELPGLHARASAWHEERLDDHPAIHHAMASGDRERMAWCVANACGRHINLGELATVRRWLDALPADLVRDHAQLAAAYAWYFVTIGDDDATARWLDVAAAAFAAGNDGGPAMRPGIPAQLALLRSMVAVRGGDAATGVAQARAAFELLPPELSLEAASILRGTASATLALALVASGDTDGAIEAYRSSLPDLRAGGNELVAARATAELAGFAIARRDPATAVQLCEAELARDGVAGSSAAGPIWAALARARAELRQPDAATDAANLALEIATRAGDEPVVRSVRATLELLRARRDGQRDGTPRPGSAPGLVEPLSPRELEVLRLVAVGRSNRQVAAELFVTVGTVKSHLHTISGKLGAANRVEAVARGRDLGLLG